MSNGRIEGRRMDYGTARFYISRFGTRYTHYECEQRFNGAISTMMRWCARTIHTRTEWDDASMRAADLRDVRRSLDSITAYVEHVQRELDKIEGKDHTAERVKALREVSGRTPAEAAAFLAKAAEIESSEAP